MVFLAKGRCVMTQKCILGVFIGFTFSAYCYDYPKPVVGYFSQKGQDKFLHEQVFKGKQKGFFVEVGAHDGISFSNSYFFEKYLGWTGLCVEPNPELFKKLFQNRSCYCEQCCITNFSGQKPFLKCTGYILEMYSGLLDSMDPRHTERINTEIATYGGDKEIIFVNCMNFKELFQKYKITHIDFLSLDIEGGEEAALRTIDFSQVSIDVIIVENNFNENIIKNYLESYRYERIGRLGKDDVYQLRYAHVQAK
jgi:FkbM family methyltransferase